MRDEDRPPVRRGVQPWTPSIGSAILRIMQTGFCEFYFCVFITLADIVSSCTKDGRPVELRNSTSTDGADATRSIIFRRLLGSLCCGPRCTQHWNAARSLRRYDLRHLPIWSTHFDGVERACLDGEVGSLSLHTLMFLASPCPLSTRSFLVQRYHDSRHIFALHHGSLPPQSNMSVPPPDHDPSRKGYADLHCLCAYHVSPTKERSCA